MSATETVLRQPKQKLEKSKEEKAQHLASGQQLQRQTGESSQSPSLSRSVATQLINLMQKVVEDEVSPATVNAACNCANTLHKFISLNLRMKDLSP